MEICQSENVGTTNKINITIISAFENDIESEQMELNGSRQHRNNVASNAVHKRVKRGKKVAAMNPKKRITAKPTKTKRLPETAAQRAARLKAKRRYKIELKKINIALLIAVRKSRKNVKRELAKYKRLKLKCGRKKREAEQVTESDIKNTPTTIKGLRESMDKLMLLRAQEKLAQKMKSHQLEIDGQKLKIRIVAARADLKKAKWDCKPKTRAKRNTVIRRSAGTWNRLLRKSKKVFRRKAWLLNHMHYIYIGKAAILKKNCKGKAKHKKHHRRHKKRRKLSNKEKNRRAWMGFGLNHAATAKHQKRKRGKRATTPESGADKKKRLTDLFNSLKEMREKQNRVEEESRLAIEADNKRLETIVKGLEKQLTDTKSNCSASAPKPKMSRVKRHVYNFYTIKMKGDDAAIAGRYDRAAKSSKPAKPTQKPAKSSKPVKATQKPAKATQKPAKATQKPAVSTNKPKKYTGRVPTV